MRAGAPGGIRLAGDAADFAAQRLRGRWLLRRLE